MNEMWTTLERYQPYAEKRGFGNTWLKMTTERTVDAAWAAWLAADTADAADIAVWAAAAAADAQLASEAIKHINRAIAWEEKR